MQCVFALAPLTAGSGNEALEECVSSRGCVAALTHFLESWILYCLRLGKIEEEMGRQASVLAGNPGQGLWPPVPFFSLTIMYSDDSAIRSETAAAPL